MKSAFWARRLHKWIGLVIGVQALLWTVSGVYMAVVSLDLVRGNHLVKVQPQPLGPAAPRLSQADLLARYPGITSLRIKRLLDRDVYEIHQGEQAALVEADSGRKITPLQGRDAMALARAVYRGQGDVARVEWLTQAPQEVAKWPAPMWAVHFSDRGGATLYFSPDSGELLARRHSLWRWYDFMWMFHIMDYRAHTDVNNPLLRTAAALGLLFVLSGVWLLFYSFRRKAGA